MDSFKKDFLRIIDQNQAIINSLCAIYFRTVDDHNDTRQDIILQLWKSFPSFRGQSKVSTWIYRVSLNTILNKIKIEKRELQKISIDPVHEYKLISSRNFDDDIEQLKQMIQSLRELDKAIVILHLEGYKNKEIAPMLGLSPSNISTRLNRIKTELKTKFRIINHEIR